MPETARRSLLRDRDVALLWTSGLVSMVGTFSLFVALPFVVYTRSGSHLGTAVTVLAGLLPPVVVGQLAGVLADRYDRRRLLLGTNVAMVALTACYLTVDVSDWWAVAVLNLVRSSVAQLLGPSEHALLPELVPQDRLAEAAGLNTLNNNLARLLGPGLGGTLVAIGGFDAAVVLTTLTFAVAAALVLAMRRRSSATPVPRPPRRGLRAEWVEGANAVRRHEILRPLLLVVAIVAVGEGFIAALLAPYAADVLGGGPGILGWILSAQAIGGVVGAWWAARTLGRRDPLRLLGQAAVVVSALLLVLFTYVLAYPQPWPAVVLTAVAGAPFAVFMASQGALTQLHAAPSERGRVFGLFWGTTALLQLAGVALAGAGAELWGPLVITVDAGAYLLGGTVALVVAHRLARQRRLRTASTAPVGS